MKKIKLFLALNTCWSFACQNDIKREPAFWSGQVPLPDAQGMLVLKSNHGLTYLRLNGQEELEIDSHGFTTVTLHNGQFIPYGKVRARFHLKVMEGNTLDDELETTQHFRQYFVRQAVMA